MYVYLLHSSSKKTYVGATINVERRVRQHNGELKGGALYTRKWVTRGDTWVCVGYVSGFPTWVDALQFEWKWKKLSKGTSLQSRLEALNVLITSDKSTASSTPFSEWDLKVHEYGKE